MDRLANFSGQIVSWVDLIAIQDAIERADAYLLQQFSLGDFPVSGFVPTPDNASLVLPVTQGSGVATDAAGRKHLLRMTADADVSLAAALPGANPKWVLVAYRFYRNGYTPRTDDQNNTANYNQDEGTSSVPPQPPFGATPPGGLVLVQGAEGGGKPAVPVDHVPICDFQLTVGQVALTSAQMDRSRARAAWSRFGVSGGVSAQVQDMASLTSNNCYVAPEEPATMSVRVRAGRVNFDGKWFTINQTDLALAAPGVGGDSRVYLIYIASDGTVNALAGTDALTGAQVAPSHVGKLPLAEVTIANGQTTVQAANIVDVRPFMKATRIVPNRYRLTGSTLTVIPLPFSYVLGANALWVYKNGALLSNLAGAANYVETDAATITLGAALIVGDVLEVIAGIPGDANPVSTHATTHAAGGADPIDYSAVNGIVGGLRMYTTADNAITIEQFGCIVGGRLFQSPAAGFALAPTTGGTGIAAGAIAYIYAFVNAGLLTTEISATVPDPNTGRRTKTGDATRIYLGAFYFMSGAGGASGKIKAFRRVGRRTVWQNDISQVANPNPATVMDGSVGQLVTSVGPTNVSLAAFIPPWVNLAEIETIVTSGAAANSANLTGKGPQVTKHSSGITNLVNSQSGVWGPYAVSLDGTPSWTLANTQATGSCWVFLHAYED